MVLCTCCYDLWFQGWWVVCSWDRQPHDHCCQPKTVQDPRLVLEQTERLQGRKVLSSCLQRPWHEAQGWSWTSQENQVKSPNTDSDQINLLILCVLLWGLNWMSLYVTLALCLGTTVGWDITGVSVSVVNTPRQLVAEARLLVSLRSVKPMMVAPAGFNLW